MKTIISAIILLLMVCSISIAAEQAASKISLQLDAVDVTDALTKLSQQANISIMADSTLKGKVSCSLTDVTTDQALNMICKMNKWEWIKVQISANTDEKLNATKIFSLIERLKRMETYSLVCDDPNTRVRTTFIPAGTSDSDVSALTSSLKMKTVYLLRAIPDPEAKKPMVALPPPPAPGMEVQAAAQKVWSTVSSLPPDQQMQLLGQLRQMARDNMTPEQRDALRSQWAGRRGGRGGGGQGNYQGPQPGQ